MFFVFVPPSVTNHPSQTFAKIQRFYNHLCSFFSHPGQFWFGVLLCCVVLCQPRSDSQITQTLLLRCSRYSRVHHHRLQLDQTLLKEVCVCAGCLEMWGLIVHLLTSLFHLVSGFTQKTSVEPRRSLAALPSHTPPLTRACVSAASDVEGFVSEIKLAGGSKQQNLTWLSIIWSTWCRVNSRWLPVELRRF